MKKYLKLVLECAQGVIDTIVGYQRVDWKTKYFQSVENAIRLQRKIGWLESTLDHYIQVNKKLNMWLIRDSKKVTFLLTCLFVVITSLIIISIGQI